MLILAAASDYIFAWQFPLFGVFFVGWLVGGGYLFHLTLSKKVQSRRGVSLGRGILISLLSGMAGAMAGAVLYKVGQVLMPPNIEDGGMPVSILGVVLGIIGYAVVAWLVVFAMHKIPVGETLSASALPIGATIGLALGIGIACALPAHGQVKERREQEMLMLINSNRLKMLYQHYLYLSPREPIESLSVLKNKEGFDDRLLKNAAKPDRELGFFYHPSPKTLQGQDARLLACDFANTYDGKDTRIVLFTDGRVAQYDEGAFQIELDAEQNQEFAEALRNAEGQ
jgi:hypothetical protein